MQAISFAAKQRQKTRAPAAAVKHGHRFRIENYLEDNKHKKHIFVELLTRIDKALRHANVPYWLDFGTALGVFRGNQIIPWDGDTDVGIMLDDHDKVLEQRSILEGPEGDYTLIEGPNGQNPQTFLRLQHKESQLYTDIYHYREEGDDLHILIHAPEGGTKPVANELLVPPKDCKLEGKSFLCPAKLEEYLKTRYTSLEPNHSWDANSNSWVRSDGRSSTEYVSL